MSEFRQNKIFGTIGMKRAKCGDGENLTEVGTLQEGLQVNKGRNGTTADYNG